MAESSFSRLLGTPMSASWVASAAGVLQLAITAQEVLSLLLASSGRIKSHYASQAAGLLLAGSIGMLSAPEVGSPHFANPAIQLCPLLMQMLHLILLRQQKLPAARFRAAMNGIAISFLVMIQAIALSITKHEAPASIAFNINIAVSLLLLPIFLSFPKGADTSFQGRPVDRLDVASLFELVTMSWASKRFQTHLLAKKDSSAMPLLSKSRRTDALVERHQRITRRLATRSLGYILAREYMAPLLLQCFLAVLHAGAVLLPALLTYRLLQLLSGEQGYSSRDGLVLAMLLGLSKVTPPLINSWMNWISSNMIAIPIYHSLAALTYQKALSVPNFAASTQAAGLADGVSLFKLTASSSVVSEGYTHIHRIISSLIQLVSTTLVLINLVGFGGVAAAVVASLLVTAFSTVALKRWETWLFRLWALGLERKVALGDALLAIRQIKLSAEEPTFKRKMHHIRDQELKKSKDIALLMAGINIVKSISPAILSGVPLYIYTAQGNVLTAPVAFTFIELFQQLQSEMLHVPHILPRMKRSWDGVKKTESFLRISDLQRSRNMAEGELSLKGASVAWYQDGKEKRQFKLVDVSAEFPVGALSIVTGKTGCGKSLLLLALAGEAEIVSGQMHHPSSTDETSQEKGTLGEWIQPGRIALITQNPWMTNTTIQENILFGLPMDKEKYALVLYSCALNEDLAQLKDGDATKIAIKGVSLSGGQRWRIALARALYSQASILLMDDVLSAVDAEVREWIVDKALCGDLAAGRTRVLVTHHEAQVIARASYRLHVCDGTAKGKLLPQTQPRSVATSEAKQTDVKANKSVMPPEKKKDANVEKLATEIPATNDATKNVPPLLPRYRTYFHVSGGFSSWTLALLFVVICEWSNMAASSRLKEWVDESTLQNSSLQYFSSSGAYYLAKSAHVVLLSIKTLVWFRLHRIASKRVFANITTKIFGARLQWLESTSHGEILRRYGPDMRNVDEVVAYDLGPIFGLIGQIATVLVASASFSFYQIPLVCTLFYFFVQIGRELIPSTKYLQGTESMASSALAQNVSALGAPDGITTVRAYGMVSRYVREFNQSKDEVASAAWHMSLYKYMMKFRLEALGAAYVALSCGFLVFSGADAGTAGVALSFASTLSHAVVETLQRFASLDSSLRRVENLLLYDQIEQERTSGSETASSWPEHGEIKVSEYSAGYGPNLPATLKDVSFTIKSGERIGVVGRTGAGKSTLALAFAELVQKRNGSITIDRVDVSEIKLDVLRKNILIIPQDPFLFGGSLRVTIDPEKQHSDDELLASLDKFGFLATAGKTEKQDKSSCLELQISEGGTNLSQGQRQIVCLVKAMLSRKKVVIMDEATSAVDLETDSAIQMAIREGLPNTTVMVIAHRLATVAHLDKVLVMQGGKVAEFGPPGDLFRQKGQFWALVNHSADRQDLIKSFSGGEGL